MIRICLTFGWLGFAAALASAAEPADNEILKLLVAAQETNRAGFDRGSQTAEIHTLWDGQQTDFTVDMTWAEAGTYWKYAMAQQDGDNRTRLNCEMIETAKEIIFYWPDVKHVQKVRDDMLGYPEQLEIRPDQAWFRIEGLAEWSALFDPEKARAGGVVVKTARDGDLVTVTHEYPSGETLRVFASLGASGNVTEYEGRPGPKSTIWRAGKYEWSPLGDGRSYLKKYDYRRSLTNNKAHPERTYSLMITSFDPTPRIPGDRFALSSLRIPKDALIEEISAAGTRRYRLGKEVSVSDERLHELGRKLKEKGFAAEKH
ncbi:MAG TPA: hypothetical protein VMV10_20200 [Pirellulales bacterium]|nr:hypothetical protein [Pirellulales bacterium]